MALHRHRSTSVLAAMALAAGFSGSLTFLPSQGTPKLRQATHAVSNAAPVPPAHWSSAASAVAAAALLVGTLPPAPAGAVVSSVPGAEPGSTVKQAKYGANIRAVLEDALANAQKKAQDSEEKVVQLEKAENLLVQLDKTRSKEIQKEGEELKRSEQLREKVLEDLDKRAADPAQVAKDENLPKAQMFFKNFFLKEQIKQEEIVKKEAEAARLREKVIADLEKKKAEARQAADEAEAVALRIEELARNARETAEATRKLAQF